jgi:hypothetical protein
VAVRLDTPGSGRGFRPKPKTERSVSGVPCETAVGDDAEGWWDGVVVVVVVVWPSGWKCKAQGGGLGQKPETGPLGLSLGCSVGNSGGGR